MHLATAAAMTDIIIDILIIIIMSSDSSMVRPKRILHTL
jgi:hypothetical protein